MVARGKGEAGMRGDLFNGYRVSSGGDENVLELHRGDGCTTS